MAERLALITGTTSGIGRALAAELLGRGWEVVGVARRDAELRHPAYRHLRVDLADLAAVQKAVPGELDRMLRDPFLDRVGLVNNAATAVPLERLEHVEAGALQQAYAVNVVAPIWLMGYFCRSCRPGSVLRIVNVSSGAAVRPSPGLGAYCSSKAALRMAGMVLAAETDAGNAPGAERCRPSVLSFEPGVVDTPMQAHARSRPPEEFPWADTFQGFAERGELVAPEAVTAGIADFLEGEEERGFVERRCGERRQWTED